MMKLTLLSDTHNRHSVLPDLCSGDVLIHSGDATNRGTDRELESFFKWFNSQPFEHKIYVPGNHDLGMELSDVEKYYRALYPKIKFLYGEAIEIEGLNFYGMPWMPKFYNWAFMPNKTKLAEHVKNIPDNTDVLITHGPPKFILDNNNNGTDCGCPLLHDRVMEVKPAFHCFGHIHEGFGHKEVNGIHFFNAAQEMGPWSMAPGHPIIVELDTKTKKITNWEFFEE